MTEGIIQQVFKKYRELRYSPWDNELQQELIEKIRQDIENRVWHYGKDLNGKKWCYEKEILDRLIGDY